MNINIRKSIINNFKDSDIEEFRSAIEESVKDSNELALPGLGVFFEILWCNSNIEDKNRIINTIKNNLI